jgi:hypothetical protein
MYEKKIPTGCPGAGGKSHRDSRRCKASGDRVNRKASPQHLAGMHGQKKFSTKCPCTGGGDTGLRKCGGIAVTAEIARHRRDRKSKTHHGVVMNQGSQTSMKMVVMSLRPAAPLQPTAVRNWSDTKLSRHLPFSSLALASGPYRAIFGRAWRRSTPASQQQASTPQNQDQVLRGPQACRGPRCWTLDGDGASSLPVAFSRETQRHEGKPRP